MNKVFEYDGMAYIRPIGRGIHLRDLNDSYLDDLLQQFEEFQYMDKEGNLGPSHDIHLRIRVEVVE